ncbi:MAG: histone deacetylase family protein [Zoogloeaceae bacterium]|jgi:acetoin utilization deacetylase AcuC-like enzyme|nr:histone deacetylase family protein [Zoogloeaceae bacterium]
MSKTCPSDAAMKAFFSPDQLLHDPRQFMRLGRIHKPTDRPARVEALSAALADCGVPLEAPPDFGEEALECVHDPDYIEFLRQAYARWQALADNGLQPGIEVLPNLWPYNDRPSSCPPDSIIAQAGCYLGDLSCPIGPGTWTSALRSAHAAIAAARAVCDGVDRAYALCRPSGHHAHVDRASGFCYLNNTAIAAQTLIRAFGRVAVLDIDAHHGDGTQHFFYHRADVLTVSIHADPRNYFPFYTGYEYETGDGPGDCCNFNLPLAHGSGDVEFVQALGHAIKAIGRFQPKAVVLAVGFDTYKDDPLSVLRLDWPSYRQTGRLVGGLGLPLVVVQEGGYMTGALRLGLTALLEGILA